MDVRGHGGVCVHAIRISRLEVAPRIPGSMQGRRRMKLSAGAIAFWQRIFAKLSQRSSVCSYVTLVGGLACHLSQTHLALIGQTIAACATVALFLLNDPQVRYVLTGKLPDAPKPPTVPQPFNSNQSDKDKG